MLLKQSGEASPQSLPVLVGKELCLVVFRRFTIPKRLRAGGVLFVSEAPGGCVGLTGGAHQGRNTVRGRFSHQDKLLADVHLDAHSQRGNVPPADFLTCFVTFRSILIY